MRPGLRDELVTEEIGRALESLAAERVSRERLSGDESAERIAAFLRIELKRVLAGMPEANRPEAQAELVNAILDMVGSDDRLAIPPDVLLGILPESGPGLAIPQLPPRPEVPLSASDLLVNGAGQPTIGSELKLELQSARDVDLICAFVIRTGVRILREVLAGVIERGGRVRVITTTYMGATEPRALAALAELGGEIRIAFDAQSTKLHAKSWLVEREGGLTTAFVGSSNLSHTALHDGLEWNVRLAEADAPHLVERVRSTFSAHWESEHFEPYDPESDEDRRRLRTALGSDRERRRGEKVSFASLDVHPYPHQQRMLDRLTVERERHDRHRNLVVAATGTGKTVVAALDYRSLRAKAGGADLSLLFVAHRKWILEQSRSTFRQVLHNGSFGELLGDGVEPLEGRHVFAMVQSLNEERLDALDTDAFDVVIIDEFHHASAPSYERMLEHLHPKELLGLTATPERMDGKDVTSWFGGRIAVELRLWEAIDQGFLVPFQYFGVADDTDLSSVTWSRGRYSQAELSELFTGDESRVGKLLRAIEDIVDDPRAMRALGFCVSVQHAEYMARQFSEVGRPAVAVSGQTSGEERDRALADLAAGKLRAVFSVDVLGEGVDVPDVDTVLLLRPTESATLFTQQIGRGLRRAEAKRCLTIIDLIGQQRREFRFDRRLATLLDLRNGPVRQQAERSFPLLPAGCEIELDRVSEEAILTNLRDTAHLGRWPTLVSDLRALGDVTLIEYLRQTDRAPEDLYKNPSYSWTRLRREAGLPAAAGGDDEERLLRAAGRLLHIDDTERIALYREILMAETPPRSNRLNERTRRLALMLHFDLWGVKDKHDSLDSAMQRLWKEQSVRDEIVDLLAVLDERSERLVVPSGLREEIPVATHGRYSRDEALAAFDVGSPDRPPQVREGVYWAKDERTDLFFVTLHKNEAGYSPTTMYRDYAISPTLFHWESQSTLRAETPTARRYLTHRQEGSNVVIFVRAGKTSPSGATEPYACLGPANYVEHRGERPLAITWELNHRMPEELFETARAVAV